MRNIHDFEDLSNRLSALSQLTIQTSYRCPICGKEHSVNDCVIIKEEVSRKFLNRTYDRELSTYRTKVYHDNYLVSYYNIRICPQCLKNRKKPYKIVLLLVAASIIAMIIRNVSMLPEKDFGSVIGPVLLVLFCGGILGLIVFGVIMWLIGQTQTIDIEKAKEYNAIVPENLFDNH